MSEYLQVLKRLEADRSWRPGDLPEDAPAARRPIVATPLASQPPVVPEAERRAFPEAERRAFNVAPVRTATAFATLFDNLRAAADGQRPRSLVFAGMSTEEPVHAVAIGLMEHVERLGIKVRVVKLAETAGRPTLTAVSSEASSPARLPLHGHRETWPMEFAQWLHLAAYADLVIVEGHPLCRSIDAALLARSCDGLVIVVRPAVTLRQDLRQAVERARAAGCRVLGLVMHGA
jgi:hypothetical protein